MKEKAKIVAIVGPTAIGKTSISIELAKILNGEIVSADSMQVYRYMDIGTAKPTLEERQGIPHHLIDIVDPDQDFNVAIYQQIAKNAIDNIHEKEKLPILVGGSGLYVNSIVYPLDFTDAKEDHKLRKKLYEVADKKGNIYLHQKLMEIDPVTGKKVHPNDVKRMVRAMEIYHLTGKPMSEYRQNFENSKIPYEIAMIGLTMDRKKLYERINQRVDDMIYKGLVSEVQELLDMGYGKELISMQGLGYKEIIKYLEGIYTLDEAIDIIKRDTRRFAKRQLTWFRKDKRIYWVDIEKFDNKEAITDHLVRHIIKKLSLNKLDFAL